MVPASQKLSMPSAHTSSYRREMVLNAAEALFSEHGFDGVTVRQVSKLAGVDVALPNYYFGSKRGLFDAVFARRTGPLNDLRQARLKEVLSMAKASGQRPLIADIVRAFISPIMEAHASHDVGWRNYCRLVAQVNSSSVWSKLMTQFFDELIEDFIAAIQDALPELKGKTLYWAYHFLSGALTLTMASTGRIDMLSKGLCHSDDAEEAYEHLVQFFAFGLSQLAQSEGVKSNDDF